MSQTSSTIDFQPIGTYPFPIASTEFSKHLPEVDIVDIRESEGNGEEKTSIHTLMKGEPPDPGSGHSALDSLGREIARSLGPQHEDAVLQASSFDIAHEVLPGTILLELSAVNASKTRLLLRAIESQHKIVDYYAVDPDQTELEQSIRELHVEGFKYVRCHGLLGTIENARAWVAKWQNRQRPKYLLSFGPRMDTSEEWRKWIDALQSSNEDRDRIVMGIDGTRPAQNAGEESSVDEDWMLRTEWLENEGKLVRYLVALRDGELDGKKIGKGEKSSVAHEYRYDTPKKEKLFSDCKLVESQKFLSEDGSYGKNPK